MVASESLGCELWVHFEYWGMANLRREVPVDLLQLEEERKLKLRVSSLFFYALPTYNKRIISLVITKV